MDVLAAILTCSLHGDDALVRAIVDNAHDNPFAILTPELAADAGPASSAPHTLEDALAQVREVTAHGGQPLLGLMQVPVAWTSTFGREPRELFDPCVNVSIGSAMLSEFDYSCGSAKSSRHSSKITGAAALAARRACVLRRYAEAIHIPELATVVTLDLHYQRASSELPNDAPIFPAFEPHTWGSDCLFISGLSGSSSPGLGKKERPASGR